jgi:hypothetical protein
MAITLELQPDVEEGLRIQANARGVTLTDLVTEIVVREAHRTKPPAIPVLTGEPKNLAELFAHSPFKGLDLEFTRDRDYGREIEL